MKFIKESFRSLEPTTKLIRTPITGHSGLYVEQNKTGYTFQLKFKSPVTGKYRFMKLCRYKYDDHVNKKMLDNLLTMEVIAQGHIASGIDPLEQKPGRKTG